MIKFSSLVVLLSLPIIALSFDQTHENEKTVLKTTLSYLMGNQKYSESLDYTKKFLKNILQMLKDGTREHIPEDWTSNLCLDTKANPPLLIKTLDQNKKKKQVYEFDEKDFLYKTKDKTIMTSVVE